MARSSAGVFPQTSKLWCCRGPCGSCGEGSASLALTLMDPSTPHGGHQCCCVARCQLLGFLWGLQLAIPARRGAGGMPEAPLCSEVVLGEDSPWGASTFRGVPAPQLTGAVCTCITRLFWIMQPRFSNTWSSGWIEVGIL